MSRHPTTPADESDLRVHLGRQTNKRIELFDILKVALPADAARAELDALLANKPDVVLFDALYEWHLETIGGLIASYAHPERPLFVVGSSGVDMALGAHWRATGMIRAMTEFPRAGPARPLLVASGSCSPVTGGQIEWALSHGFAEVALDTPALANAKSAEVALRCATDTVVTSLAAGRHTIVHTSRGGNDARVAATATALLENASTARLLGEALGTVVRAAVARTGVRRVLIAGGDTSGYLARTLGIEALEMIAPLTPGAPLCRASAPGSPADGLELNFKGGQVGSPDYFEAVACGQA